MSLLDLARRDYNNHITNLSGAGVNLTFTTPDKSVSVVVRGVAMSRSLSFDTDGQEVNSKKVHITFTESDLEDAGYTVRGVDNRVSLYKHLVSYVDSTGSEKTFVIVQDFPDETLDLITCILGEYAG